MRQAQSRRALIMKRALVSTRTCPQKPLQGSTPRYPLFAVPIHQSCRMLKRVVSICCKTERQVYLSSSRSLADGCFHCSFIQSSEPGEIGSASVRERVCQYGEIS